MKINLYHNLCFFYFEQKSLFTENYYLITAINLATRGPLYTCLVYSHGRSSLNCFKSMNIVNYQEIDTSLLALKEFYIFLRVTFLKQKQTCCLTPCLVKFFDLFPCVKTQATSN